MKIKQFYLVVKAEIIKQQHHDYHSPYVYFSLLVWPVLGFLEIYFTYKPFAMNGYMGISGSNELLAFLGTGAMAHTCFWSMVQNAWSMAGQERRGGTLEIAFLTPANRLAISYGKALGALLQEVWMFTCFCIFILLYAGALNIGNMLLMPLIFLLLILSSTIWGGMLNAIFMFSRDASVIMDIFSTPMTLFSGVRIPVRCFPQWARILSMLFPLTYCINIIRFAFRIYDGCRSWIVNLGELCICLLTMILITVVLIHKAEKHNRRTGELQFY